MNKSGFIWRMGVAGNSSGYAGFTLLLLLFSHSLVPLGTFGGRFGELVVAASGPKSTRRPAWTGLELLGVTFTGELNGELASGDITLLLTLGGVFQRR